MNDNVPDGSDGERGATAGDEDDAGRDMVELVVFFPHHFPRNEHGMTDMTMERLMREENGREDLGPGNENEQSMGRLKKSAPPPTGNLPPHSLLST
jgi:hypothetical protein